MTPDADAVLGAASLLRELLSPLVERIAALEQITKALETREYIGVWAPGVTYPKFASVTYDGHLWLALEKTHEQPGEGCTSWRLIVRRGKQGREGKPGKPAPPCQCAERARVAS